MAITRILELFNNACSAMLFNNRATVYGEFERMFMEAVIACFEALRREGLRKFTKASVRTASLRAGIKTRSLLNTYEEP
jgi:hypothetical protein